MPCHHLQKSQSKKTRSSYRVVADANAVYMKRLDRLMLRSCSCLADALRNHHHLLLLSIYYYLTDGNGCTLHFCLESKLIGVADGPDG
mmetsp:Transcript_22329/g.67947  ORF Transcript_22329/g.67947 Transcript_22329/m.67947 type:complete len:88 (-) Transcript_22329:19-282(-)|eukprot:scaffold164898_cov36-Tisochrysis_lutea.AAC.3